MDFLRAAGASTRKWVARADGEGRLSFSVVMEPWAALAATQLWEIPAGHGEAPGRPGASSLVGGFPHQTLKGFPAIFISASAR